MKCFSIITAFSVLFCAIYVTADDSKQVNWNAKKEQDNSWQLVDQIGHNLKTQTNLFVDDDKTAWRSRNNEHEIHADGNLGQNFGGPYGRSPLSREGQINYVRRFRRQIAPINSNKPITLTGLGVTGSPNKPFTLNGQVTHGQGVTGVNAAGTARLWESQNQRHQLHGMGSYGQVFTPYGNSQPNYGAGLGYVFRF